MELKKFEDGLLLLKYLLLEARRSDCRSLWLSAVCLQRKSWKTVFDLSLSKDPKCVILVGSFPTPRGQEFEEYSLAKCMFIIIRPHPFWPLITLLQDCPQRPFSHEDPKTHSMSLIHSVASPPPCPFVCCSSCLHALHLKVWLCQPSSGSFACFLKCCLACRAMGFVVTLHTLSGNLPSTLLPLLLVDTFLVP